jgi:tetratricopeptide (TPR) repeat protein
VSDEFLLSPQTLRGLQLRQIGRYADAAGAFREALAQEPHNAFVLHQLALCQLQLKQSRESLETIGQAIAQEPEEADHFVLQSFILSEADRPKEALGAARTALGLDPHHSGAFTAEAQAHLGLTDWPAAERAARQALALDPDLAIAANQLAHALRLQNKMDENAEQIAGMLARDPEDADTHAAAGWSALQRGRHRDAETHFREALRIEPDHASAREGMLNSFRARSRFYRGYLAYVFWMQRLGTKTRWAVVIGLYLAVKFSRAVFRGPAAGIGMAITALYFLFVLWVWLAKAVGNFILLFDPFARLVLRRDEKLEAVAVGGCLALGLIAVGAGLGMRIGPLIVPGIALLAATFPFSMTFTNRARVGAWICGGLASLTLLGGFLIGLHAMFPVIPEDLSFGIFSLGIFGCLLTTWLGNLPFFRQT